MKVLHKTSTIALVIGLITSIIPCDAVIPIIFFATTLICMTIEDKKDNL